MSPTSNRRSVDQGCDVAPITDWGFEPPDTEAALATLADCVCMSYRPSRKAALDSIASELKRVRAERDSLRFELDGLEHVRVKDNAYLLARLDRAVGALR